MNFAAAWIRSRTAEAEAAVLPPFPTAKKSAIFRARRQLGGFVPCRTAIPKPIPMPPADLFDEFIKAAATVRWPPRWSLSACWRN